MEKLCSIQNVGIYLAVNNEVRKNILHNRLLQQLDGFNLYYENILETEKIVVKDLQELQIPQNSIVVPQNAYYFPDGTFYSLEARIAFRLCNTGMDFWCDENVWYLPYMLQYLLETKQRTFVHGAGIAVNDTDGYLLVAFGGIGKTCFVANAIKRDNVKLLGDDLIIVAADGTLRSYPRPFCLYPYHKALFPEFFEGKKLHFEEMRTDRYFLRASRKLKKKLHIPDPIIYDYLPVSPIHLFPKEKVQVEPVKVKKVFVLRRIVGLTEVQVKPAKDRDRVASFTHSVIQHEWSVGIRLEFNYLAHQEHSYKDTADAQYQTIRNCLDHAEEFYYIDIPGNMDAERVSFELNRVVLDGEKCNG